MLPSERRRQERQLVETFLQAHVTELKPSTRSKYLYNVLSWLRFLDGEPPTPELLQTYGRKLKEWGLRPRTRHGYQAALMLFFAWMRRTGRLAGRRRFDVRKLLDAGKLDEARVVWATDADVESMWQAAYALPHQTLRQQFVRARALAILALACYSGLRRDAILNLELRDLDRDVTPWILTARVTKRGNSHWVPLPQCEQFQLIVEYWLDVRSRWCADRGHRSEFLFPVDRVRTLGQAGITTIFKMLCAEAGIRARIRAHVFRRWYASDAAKKHGVQVVQKLLGHSHISTTLRYIRSGNQQEMNEAANTLPMFQPAAGASLDPTKPAPVLNGHGPHGKNGTLSPTGMHLWSQLLAAPEQENNHVGERRTGSPGAAR